jgi:transcriptional regulator with XRE-family HTH domain
MQDNAIGRYIKQRRSELNMGQRDLQERLEQFGYKYSVATVGHWEQGHVAVPLGASVNGSSFLAALAKSLEVSELRLLEVAGLVDRADLKFDVDAYEFAQLLDRATPTQRKIIKQVLEEMVRNQ